jgi:MFS transporter, Spinster family, sphingosine-1-phosphate transporter
MKSLSEERTPSVGYLRYVAILLSVSYMFNYADRVLIALLVQPIKRDLALSDTEIGLLLGPAFALSYAICGFLFAYWADRGDRRLILTVVVSIWSAATALCGGATKFVQLFALRIVVGLGEAGGMPCAMSMIGDYFAKENRSSAYSLLWAGAPTGILVASFAGGAIADSAGWRWAFVTVGLSGLVFAVLLWSTLREPRKSFPSATLSFRAMDRNPVVVARAIGAAIRVVWSSRSARQLLVGWSILTFLGFGILNWMPAFFLRVHHMSVAEAGRLFGLASGAGMMAGMVLGGVVGDWLVAKEPKWMILLPILAVLASLPFYVATITATSKYVSVISYCLAGAIWSTGSGPLLNALQSAVHPSVRATTAAILMFAASLIGIGGASVVVGALSDFLMQLNGRESLANALLVSLIAGPWGIAHLLLALRSVGAPDVGGVNI